MKARVLYGLLGLLQGHVVSDHVGHLHLSHAAVDQQFHIGILLHHDTGGGVLVHDFTRLQIWVVALSDLDVEVRVLLVGDDVLIELAHQIGHLQQVVAGLGAVVPVVEEVNHRHGEAHDDGRRQHALDHHGALGAAAGAHQLLLVLVVVVVSGRLAGGVVGLHAAGSVVPGVGRLQIVVEHNVGIAAELVQVVQHLPGGLEPVHGVFLHGAHGDLLQAPGDGGVQLPGHDGLSLQLHQRHRDGVVRHKGQLAGEHLVEHDAHRVDVRLIGDIVAAGLLGGDVVHRANGLVGHGLGLALEEAGNAEVGHLDGAVLQEHDVLGLDVPVDDALLVGALQGHEDLGGEVDSLLPADGALLLDILLQGDAVDKLHDDVLDLVAKADIVHLDNVGVVEHRDGLGLIAETAQEIAVVGKFFLQNLDGHPAALHAVVGLVDIGHAAHADKLVDFVPAIQALADESIHKQLPYLSEKSRGGQPLKMTAAVILSEPPHCTAY